MSKTALKKCPQHEWSFDRWTTIRAGCFHTRNVFRYVCSHCGKHRNVAPHAHKAFLRQNAVRKAFSDSESPPVAPSPENAVSKAPEPEMQTDV